MIRVTHAENSNRSNYRVKYTPYFETKMGFDSYLCWDILIFYT